MIDLQLRQALGRVVNRAQQAQLGWWLAGSWTGMSLLALTLGWLQRHGLILLTPRALACLALVGLTAVLVIARHLRNREPAWRQLARRIEQRFPQLEGLLLTAVQQQGSGILPRPFLQQHLLAAASNHPTRNRWHHAIARWRIALAHSAHLLALTCFASTLWLLTLPAPPPKPHTTPLPLALPNSPFSVLPGNVRLERGSSLVVLARLGSSIPRNVTLVIQPQNQPASRTPMTQSLGDPLFGARFEPVESHLNYHVEYDGTTTRTYHVTVFERPRLVRADASLQYPEYTQIPPRRLEDTRRVSAVERSLLQWDLQLNKPVARARLVPRDTNQPPLALHTSTTNPAATLGPLPLTTGGQYDLILTDADGLTNTAPALFTVDVLPNRPPEVRLTRPRGDLRPSALEEVTFDGTARDDFGLLAFGIAYNTNSGDPTFLPLSPAPPIPSRDKVPFSHRLHLEDLGVAPDQLITWFTWADDLGPDGQPRRTLGDLFFAETRPFEEIFRENTDGGESEPANGQNPEQPGGGGLGNLIQLQKQILVATWALQRNPSNAALPRLGNPQTSPDSTPTNTPTAYTDNASVLRNAQSQARDQAREILSQDQPPEVTILWEAVVREMSAALDKLDAALHNPSLLAQATPREQAAYQALLQLQDREYAVSRARRQSRSASNRNSSLQRQLDQLDLTQAENRYETQRQAQEATSENRREQSDTLRRLQELARRRQDANDQLRELQTALREARTDSERQDLQRQLERLTEEQRQMLSDLDELREQLNRSEDPTLTEQQSRELDATRDALSRAADASARRDPAQALAEGNRAERQLRDLREATRRQSASAFAEELRQMRHQAREAAQQQETLRRALDDANSSARPTLSDADRHESVLEQLEPQRQRVRDLADQAAEVSRQAEASEPLVSRELYEAFRNFTQAEADTAKRAQSELLERGLLTRRLYEQLNEPTNASTHSLDLTAELIRQNQIPAAQQAEGRTRAGIDQLRRGIERAAEQVLGDDTASLRRARDELDQLTREVQQEIAASQPTQTTPGPDVSRPASESASQEPGARTPADAAPGTPAAAIQDLLREASPENRGSGAANPLTGPGFADWTERLRNVEDMLEIPELRDRLATTRQRARTLRQDLHRNQGKPDWAVVQLQIEGPLLETRNLVADELARRQPDNRIVPSDRDPVPGPFAERTRLYYEALSRTRKPTPGQESPGTLPTP